MELPIKYLQQEVYSSEHFFNLFIESLKYKSIFTKLMTPMIKIQCSKHVNATTCYFKCWTCSNINNHMICQECFYHSNHQHHSYQMQLESNGCCDCGDQNFLKTVCSLHIQQDQNTENLNELQNQSLEEFGLNLAQLLQITFQKENDEILQRIVVFLQRFNIAVPIRELIWNVLLKSHIKIVKGEQIIWNGITPFILSKSEDLQNNFLEYCYTNTDIKNLKQKIALFYFENYEKCFRILKKNNNNQYFENYEIQRNRFNDIIGQFTNEFSAVITEGKMNNFLKLVKQLNEVKYEINLNKDSNVIDFNSQNRIEQRIFYSSVIDMLKQELEQDNSCILDFFSNFIDSICSTLPLQTDQQVQKLDFIKYSGQICRLIFIEKEQLLTITQFFYKSIQILPQKHIYHFYQQVIQTLFNSLKKRNSFNQTVKQQYQTDFYYLFQHVFLNARIQDQLFFYFISHFKNQLQFDNSQIYQILQIQSKDFHIQIIFAFKRALQTLMGFHIIQIQENTNDNYYQQYLNGPDFDLINQYSFDINIIKQCLSILTPDQIQSAINDVFNIFFQIFQQFDNVIYNCFLTVMIQVWINEIHDINIEQKIDDKFNPFISLILQTLFTIKNPMKLSEFTHYLQSCGLNPNSYKEIENKIEKQLIYVPESRSMQINSKEQYDPFLLINKQTHEQFFKVFINSNDKAKYSDYNQIFGKDSNHLSQFSQEIIQKSVGFMKQILLEFKKRLMQNELNIFAKMKICDYNTTGCTLLYKTVLILKLEDELIQELKLPNQKFNEILIREMKNCENQKLKAKQEILKQQYKENMKNSHLLKDENNKDKDNDNNGDSADLNNCSICKNANDSYMVLIYMNSKQTLNMHCCNHVVHELCQQKTNKSYCEYCKKSYNFILNKNGQFDKLLDFISIEFKQQQIIHDQYWFNQIIQNLIIATLSEQSQIVLLLILFKQIISLCVLIPIENTINQNQLNQTDQINLYTQQFINLTITQDIQQLNHFLSQNQTHEIDIKLFNIFHIITNQNLQQYLSNVQNLQFSINHYQISDFQSLFASNMQEQYQALLNNKCCLCQNYPTNPDYFLVQCLFCLKIMCKQGCQKQVNNILVHCNREHSGLGLFYKVNDGKIIAIYKNEIREYEFGLYRNKYGESIDLCKGFESDPEGWKYELDIEQVQKIGEKRQNEYLIIDYINQKQVEYYTI